MITNLSIGRYGRLGNQIYQYASAFSLAKKLNTELWIAEESENYNHSGRFNPIINGHDIYNNDLFRLFNLKFVTKKKLREIENNVSHYHNEDSVVRYYPEFWELPDNTCLTGYFQAKEYVDMYEKNLREELKFNDYYFNYGIEMINKLKENYNKIVSLHVRRGDLSADNGAYNADLSIDGYYKKIVSENVTDNDIVLVFSDDIDWCKNQFDSKNFMFIDNRDGSNSHLKDFALMSMCDINIMAVSTFSWWASWLNPLNIEKKVFMPNKWWGRLLEHNSEEIYRYDKWIKYDNL